MKPEVIATVTSLALEIFELDRASVDPNANLITDLGATSISRLEFLVAVERRFNVQLDLEEIETAGTLNDLITMISRRVG